MKTAMGLVLALALAIPAAAQKPWLQEPAGFRGLPWGSPLADTVRAFPEGFVSPIGNFLKVERFDVGTVRTKLYMTFKGFGTDKAGGGLWTIDMEFALSDMSTMKTIFVTKYGQPTGHRTEDGDRLMQWKGKHVQIELGPLSVEHTGHAVFTVLAVDAQVRKENADSVARQRAEQARKNRKAVDAF